MLKDITLGQYFPIQSPLHNLDPRTKILSLILLIIAIFLADNWIGYILVTAFVLSSAILSHVPLKMYFKGLKPIWFVIVFTAVLNIFLTKEGERLVFFGWTSPIYDKGVILAAKMALRLVLLIISSSILTYTTSPITLTDGIEKLLKPLSKLGLPTYELAMMMSIAIRFIPTLIEETDKIMKAQKARGADFETGSLLQRVKALAPMLIPLFISAFRRADELAIAMESRCYQGGATRTRLREIHFKKNDLLACMIFLLFLAGLITGRILL